jgi:hypothetical protein
LDFLMKTMVLAGLSAATLFASAAPAIAATASPAGHWAWKPNAQFGRRASVPMAHRVWIADPATATASDCKGMSASMPPADCMAMMKTAQPNG